MTSSRRPSVASTASATPAICPSRSCVTAACPYGERPCHWKERTSLTDVMRACPDFAMPGALPNRARLLADRRRSGPSPLADDLDGVPSLDRHSAARPAPQDALGIAELEARLQDRKPAHQIAATVAVHVLGVLGAAEEAVLVAGPAEGERGSVHDGRRGKASRGGDRHRDGAVPAKAD